MTNFGERHGLRYACLVSQERSRRLPIVDARADQALTADSSAAKKVELFRRRFRGRGDVYARLWVNATTGKSGYAPACANEWVRGTCGKPRVPCRSCDNQAFLPMTEAVVLDHLRGRHVIGVYPLLLDDTCWFLALDLDECSWQADVVALTTICDAAKVPVLVERSRSGNGAHLWFFFAEPVPAATARRMGSHLVTETMARHPELPLTSFDRMFPAQDGLRRGGLGNLIALPLQREARRQGNSLFIGSDFEPLDPWRALAEYSVLSRARVEAIAHATESLGTALGLPRPTSSGRDQTRPTGADRSGLASAAPREVHVRHEGEIVVPKAGLAAPLVSAIKRLAAFENPEYFRRQNLRLSVSRTPRFISCARDVGDDLVLPRGCREPLEALLRDLGSALVVHDERERGAPITVAFSGQLTVIQEEASRVLLEHDEGILVAPPGTGKTVAGAYMVAQRATSTLVLVHRTQLLEQWAAELARFLGRAPDGVGRLGGGACKLNGEVDVATFQSLVRGDTVDDLVRRYGHVIVDECHHASSVSFERVLRAVRARYVIGLTATPRRRDGHDPIAVMQLGPIRWRVAAKDSASARLLDHHVVVRDTGVAATSIEPSNIQGIYDHLARHDARNELIVKDVSAALEAGRTPLVLTERLAHLEALATRLRHQTANVFVLHGGLRKRERDRTVSQLRETPDNEDRVVVATGPFAGEGFDDPRLDTLFLALPIAWEGKVVQYAGRLHRAHHAKVGVQIFDYVDGEIPALARMFDKRHRKYKTMGYEISKSEVFQLSLAYGQSTAAYVRAAAVDPDAHDDVADDEGDPDPIPDAELDAMIDDVLEGAFTRHEQSVAFLELLDDQLDLPFRARAGRSMFDVVSLSLTSRDDVAAEGLTATGRRRRVPLARVSPVGRAPLGWEWVEAHNRWIARETEVSKDGRGENVENGSAGVHKRPHRARK